MKMIFSNATISTRALMPRKQKLHSKHLSNMQRNRKIEMMTKPATIIWLRRIAAAAAIALILMGTWMYFGHQGSTPPAVITAELHQAIERVQQNDMNGATLTINGKTIKVKDAQSALAQTEKVADSKDGSSFFGNDEITERLPDNKERQGILDGTGRRNLRASQLQYHPHLS